MSVHFQAGDKKNKKYILWDTDLMPNSSSLNDKKCMAQGRKWGEFITYLGGLR